MCPACFLCFESKRASKLTDFQSVSILSPTINKIIQVSNGEIQNDNSTQPKGSRRLAFAIRYTTCMYKKYTKPNATAAHAINSNISHRRGSTTTRIVCKIKPVILPCKISTRILPCICGRDSLELHHSYNRHNDPYTHIHPT